MTLPQHGRPTPAVPKLEVSEAQVRAFVTQAVDFTNQGLALVYKLGTAQDPKQTAQVRPLSQGVRLVQEQRDAASSWLCGVHCCSLHVPLH